MATVPVSRLARLTHATPAGAAGQQASSVEFPAEMLRQLANHKKTRKKSSRKMEWRLLLPGASEPRLAELNPPGLQTWFFKPLTRPEQPEHSCRLQLLHSPITAEPYREKTRPLRPRRSCFAPAKTRQI